MGPINNGGSAFTLDGMSLRDYLAAQVLLGFVAYGHNADNSEWITKQAYKLADAMLKARQPSAV